MSNNPIRHLLFLSALLFVILSSGSLQCALNCYERNLYSASALEVADCHPGAHVKTLSKPIADLCHSNHSTNHAKSDPVLHSIAGNPALALSNSRWDAPAYRCAEPLSQPAAVDAPDGQLLTCNLPLSQNLKALRSTILIM